MADVTGAVHHQSNGKSYTLALTARGMARLQATHGRDLGGMIGGTEDVPRFDIMLDIVSEGLRKGEGIAKDVADDLADDLLTADLTLAAKVLGGFFPDSPPAGEEGNGQDAGETGA